MKRKFTQRNNFDPMYVLNKLEDGDSSVEELARVLGEACQVIQGLRYDLATTLMTLDGLVTTRQFWINGKVAKK